MEDFFLNHNSVGIIKLFSTSYFIYLLFTILFFISINKKIKKFNKKQYRRFEIIIGIVFLLAWIIRRGIPILYGTYNWRFNLDVGYCSFLNLVFIVYCFSGNEKILKYVYLVMFGGPTLSILLPCVNFSILNYSFYYSFLTHNILFALVIGFVIYRKVKISNNDFIKCYIVLLIFLIAVYYFNHIFGTNFIYLSDLLNQKLLSNSFIYSIASNYWYSLFSLLFINFILLVLGLLINRKMK